MPVDTNNLQPRVGLAWNVDGSGRLVLRGGVGLYTQQHLLYPINRVQLEGAEGVPRVSAIKAVPGDPNARSPRRRN